MNENSPPRKLTRSRNDRYIGGVAAGIANRLNIDPIFVRIAFVASLIFGGLGLIAYFVLLAVMPVEGNPSEPLPPIEPKRRNRMIGLAVVVGVICLASVDSGSAASWLFGFWPGTVFGVLFWTAAAGVAFWLVFKGLIGQSWSGESSPSLTEPTTSVVDPEAETRTFAEAPTQVSPTAVMPAVHEDPDGPGERAEPETTGRTAASMIGRAIFWCAVGLAAMTLFCTLFVVSAGATAVFGGIPMAALVVILGAGMVFAALRGRRQLSIWLLTAAVAITIPMAIISIADLRIEGSYGDINETPMWASDVPEDGYKLASGAMTIDLRNLETDMRKNGVTLPVKGGMGVTSIIVNDDVCVLGSIDGKVGAANFRGYERNGVNIDLSGPTGSMPKLPHPRDRPPMLHLSADFKVGAMEVVDNTTWQQFGHAGSFDQKGSASNIAAQRRAKAACNWPSESKKRPSVSKKGV